MKTKTFKEYREYVRSDLYRLEGAKGIKKFVRHVTMNPGFKYIFWMRTCSYLQKRKYLLPLYVIARILYNRYTYRYGIWIPFNTEIGKGFYIGHFGGIIIGGIVKFGNNCNISQNVTIGKQNIGDRIGAPVIGNNVYIGPGAKIFGSISIGNEVAIGANAVVTKDIPDQGVVMGNPGRIIAKSGVEKLIEYVDYD